MVQLLQQNDGRYIRNYAGDTHSFIQYLAWLSQNESCVFSYMTALGEDKFGTEMLKDWQNHGLDTSLVMTTDTKNTGLYFADTDENGHRDYTYYRSDSAAKLIFQLPESVGLVSKLMAYDLIYISAITLMILNDEDKDKLINLFETAQENGIQTVFDTNYRPAGWASDKVAREWIDKILPHTSLCFPTNDENATLYKDKTPEDTAKRIFDTGVSEVVVKCGADGCLIKTQDETVHVAAVNDVAVTDTTAAGDSFNAGYVYGRIHDKLPYEAARLGHKVAAEVIQHQGALVDPALLNSLRQKAA